MKLFFKPFLIIFPIVIIGCAQPVSPTGGDTDKNPPKLISTNLGNNSINSKPKKIVINFDENIQLNNPNQNIIISPNPGKIKIGHTNKSIEIFLNPDSLKDNTTYAIELNETVADLNEGNKGVYNSIKFSTGSQIDTGIINGSIFPITNPKIANYKVWAYTASNDENKAIFRNKVVNKNFTISGLDSLPKSIWVYNDLNNNNKPDAGEDIGFKNYKLPNKDSVKLFVYPAQKYQLDVYENNGNTYIGSIGPFLKNSLKHNVLNAYFFKDTVFTNTNTITELLTKIPDEYYIKPNIINLPKKSPEQLITYTDINDSNRNTVLEFNNIIKGINKNKIKVFNPRDSSEIVKYEIVTIDANHLKVVFHSAAKTINCNMEPGTIEFNTGPLQNIVTFISESTANIGAIALNNPSDTLKQATLSNNGKNYYLSLLPRSMQTIYVPRGTYNLQYFEDYNQDYQLTQPDPSKEFEGEKYIILEQIISKPGIINEIKL